MLAMNEGILCLNQMIEFVKNLICEGNKPIEAENHPINSQFSMSLLEKQGIVRISCLLCFRRAMDGVRTSL